ncbi:MAG: hypothetical protein QOF25_4366 [Mycobacterium sp.]|jgi:hypothetical protein|nr:hypothetical protein [Mycobacterium sp.]
MPMLICPSRTYWGASHGSASTSAVDDLGKNSGRNATGSHDSLSTTLVIVTSPTVHRSLGIACYAEPPPAECRASSRWTNC